MQHLNKLEKSRGIVVFAFNTELVDYVRIADLTSRLTAEFLNLPITLITDQTSTPKFDYDTVIRVDYAGSNFRPDGNGNLITWKNFGRYLAYQLSPYHETILLDGDYLTLSDSLLKLWDQPFDYKLMYNSTTPDGKIPNSMSQVGLDFVWATVVLFRKTLKSKMLFDLVGRIQRNYPYYKTLFTGDGPYRNDYAFAIADLVLNGYRVDHHQGIPWQMMTIENTVTELVNNSNQIIIREANRAVIVPLMDLHIMDKKYLEHAHFERFVNEITDES